MAGRPGTLSDKARLMPAIVFTPPQTVADFMVSEAFVRLIAGPVASGKTTGCIFELYRRSAEQRKGVDGFRHTRWAIVRQTLQQLKQTVLKDILAWLPGIASWRVSESTIYVESGDIRSEWLLVPLDNLEDQRRLLSSQLTGAWLSECIEMDAELIAPLSGRIGRYPGANEGGCSWAGIIADTNFPEEGTAWHERMENPPPDWMIFKQKGGLSAEAENIQWLNQTPDTLRLPENHPDRIARGRAYYERLARNPSPAWVNRYVHAHYGIDPSGSAVFAATFNRRTHVVPSIQPITGSILIIGQDFGRDPCSVITQLAPWNQLLCLEEVLADDIGLEVHIRQNLRPRLMQARYLGMPVCVIGDPAGGNKESLYEITAFDLLKSNGFMAFPAPTNIIDPRLRAVEYWLMSGSSRGGPGMIIDNERCPMLVRAMNGGYRFEKQKAISNEMTGENKVKPHKDNYSHVADALQYACLAAQGGTLGAVTSRFFGRNLGKDQQPAMSPRAWS